MPRVNIYIRDKDWETWQSIENKPEWLHEHLNNNIIELTIENERLEYMNKNPESKPEFIDLSGFVDDGVETVKYEKISRTNFDRTRSRQVCEHYQVKGKCLVKKCKYGVGK